jgi:hypothetical protein
VCLELKQPFQHVCSPWRARRRECIDLNSKAQAAAGAWEFSVGSEKAAHHTSSVGLWLLMAVIVVDVLHKRELRHTARCFFGGGRG